MPRVLHLFNIFGALTERSIWENALSLAEAGCDLHIGYESLAPDAPPVSLPCTQLQRVRVEPVDDIDAQMDGLAANVSDPAMIELLCRHDSGEQRFDLIHGHFGPRILQAAPWLARGVPVVVSIYGYDAARLLSDPAWAARYRWAARHGAVFVALAQSMRQRLAALDIPDDRLCLIHLGIDLARHEFAPRPAPAAPRFVFVGRFVEKKGAADLISAASLLHERKGIIPFSEQKGIIPLDKLKGISPFGEQKGIIPFESGDERKGIIPFEACVPFESGEQNGIIPFDKLKGISPFDSTLRRTPPVNVGADPAFSIDLIGGGPLEESLRCQVAELGLSEQVRFVGPVSFERMFDHFAGATALVQPSVTAADGDAEGAPMVLMHAQAAGLPCITTRHSGNPEVLPPPAQPWVVREHDPAALADAMSRLAQLAPAERDELQQAGRRWIEDRFNREQTTRDYLRVYEELGKEGGMKEKDEG